MHFYTLQTKFKAVIKLIFSNEKKYKHHSFKTAVQKKYNKTQSRYAISHARFRFSMSGDVIASNWTRSEMLQRRSGVSSYSVIPYWQAPASPFWRPDARAKGGGPVGAFA